MFGLKLLVILSCTILLSTNLSARGDSDSARQSRRLDSILNSVDNRLSKQSSEDSILNSIRSLAKEDTILKKAFIQYQLFGLKHRQQVLAWNLTSSRIIFWSVILLVFAGIAFAGLQFYAALYKKGGTSNSNTTLATELEANLKGFKVNSPVLGVIILLTSFLFFYLYLVYVYPITEVF
jgi:hypothetical protein